MASSRANEREIALTGRKKEAAEIVDTLAGLVDDVRRIPGSFDDARRIVALRNVEAALASPLGNLSREQLTAAVLLGRGLTFGETAEVLECGEANLHVWMRSNPDFRREMAAWREAKELDIEARLHRQVEVLFARVDDMEDQNAIRLLALAQKISARPEDRARWSADHKLEHDRLELQREGLFRMRDGVSDERGRVQEILQEAEAEVYEGIAEVLETGQGSAESVLLDADDLGESGGLADIGEL